jgi:hypothetical protein
MEFVRSGGDRCLIYAFKFAKDIEFELIDQGPLLDTVHRGIMIRGKIRVLYAPHGLKGFAA